MKRFKNILCVIDGQPADRHALERAVALAENNQARVTVATVIESVPAAAKLLQDKSTPADLQARLKDARVRWLDTLIEPYKTQVEINSKVFVGTSFLEIIREVLRNGNDLVIKCPESPDWLDRFFTSDDMHLLRKCPCPVWLIKPEEPGSYRQILAAVDVDDSYPPVELKTRQALNVMVVELAGSLAVSEFAQLHVVHAWEVIGENALRHSAFMGQPEDKVNAYVDQVSQHHSQLLDTLIQETGEKLGADAMDYVIPQLHLLKGPARQEIPALAKRLRVDCIIMGTVARTGIRGFIMGNTAETILNQIDCSVLAIKPPGFETPVALDD